MSARVAARNRPRGVSATRSAAAARTIASARASAEDDPASRAGSPDGDGDVLGEDVPGDGDASDRDTFRDDVLVWCVPVAVPEMCPADDVASKLRLGNPGDTRG